ncbi:OLC1v1020225C3 [Oldenlandia corymbosa var. corymbosa]|uniref:Glutamine synthetase n=1 Tax=Oldenlandia corymbosa var. corymbosa TaxID=529605 RepID=A0AAV1EG57_OLDCO|nr:OLC1v1020225C3 [Oldenlandia corymbosa var. corymbosa]
MAQILAPSPQWQMRIPKCSVDASPLTSKMWSPLVLKQNSSKGAVKTSAKFRVFALQSDGSTINRVEQLLNLDVTPYTDKIIAEYIWIGGSGTDVRSKSRTISKPVEHPSELPKWNYDGSSTGQAPGEDSEVILYPQAIFKDPFRGGNNILVICDTYTPAGEPIPTNKRHKAAQIFSDPKVVSEVPWFGIEQEYTLLQKDVNWPLGWPVGGYPGPQGPYYCGAGADKSFGRDISDAHYKACLYAGINISGTNGEVMPGQWEFQVGPSVGIEAGDHIWCARYLLERITEQAGVVLSLDPKPIEGDWNGAGCHTNYSTKSMREDGGFEKIKKAILNLSLRHKEHISAYGEGNERRLTGKHETASINTFSWGVANRGCSIRVGRDTEKNGKGYLEDRRPASNMDPYVVTGLLAETTILWEPTLEAEALAAQKLALKKGCDQTKTNSKAMASGVGKSAAFTLLILNCFLYFVVAALSGWAVNHGITKARETASQLTIPAHIFPIYFPVGNMATGFLIIFSLIAGVVGFVSSISSMLNVIQWNLPNLHSAAATSMITWLLTLLAMGVACKEIRLGRTESNLRTLETMLIILSGTQMFTTGAIHAGIEDLIAREEIIRGRL